MDWEQQEVCCPQGKRSASWQEHVAPDGHPSIIASFRRQDCPACPARPLCTQAQQQGRRLRLPPQEEYEALAAARAWYASEEGIESPYDADARYRHKRDTSWTGYMVHVSETCEPTAPHLLTHVHTTSASVHEAQCTTPMQQALLDKELPPREHFVDAASISAELLVHSRDEQGIILRGPTRPSQGWQRQVAGA